VTVEELELPLLELVEVDELEELMDEEVTPDMLVIGTLYPASVETPFKVLYSAIPPVVYVEDMYPAKLPLLSY